MRSPFALVIAAVFASASLTTAAGGAEMWGKVESGMTWDQVAALYPAGKGTKHKPGKQIEIDDVPIIGECKAEANIFFKASAVDRVVLKGNPAVAARCADTVLTALSSKYGEAVGKDDTGSSLLMRAGKIYVWNKPPLTLRFKKFEDGSYGGGNLMQASWELTYSTVGEAIGL